jgi:hypothetical protein
MTPPNILVRLVWSLVIFLRFIFDGGFGARVMTAWKGEALPPAAPPPPAPPRIEPKPPPPPAPKTYDYSSALHFLSVLQREGRLVDFLQEDIAGYSDSEVGAAVRVVHDGCNRVLKEYLSLEALRTEGEGAQVTVPVGFDPAAVRLTGAVAGNPPFHGALRHHGWKAAQVRLPAPPANVDPTIIAPAEVEL